MKDKDAKNKNKTFEQIKKDVVVYKRTCKNRKIVYDKDKKQVEKETTEIVKLTTNIKKNKKYMICIIKDGALKKILNN